MPDPDTGERLRRTRDGDDDALGALIRDHLDWIQRFVRRRMSGLVRDHTQTMDVVQDALIQVLRYGPELAVQNEGQFRALTGRIVENTLRDRFAYLTAQKRNANRDATFDTRAIAELDDRPSAATPSQDAMRHEEDDRLTVALELLPYHDRLVVRLRHERGLSFARIGDLLGVGDDAARKRHDRALVKMRGFYEELRRGNLRGALEASVGERVRQLVDSILGDHDEHALDHLARTSPGETTRTTALGMVESTAAARAVFRAVPFDADEDRYLAEIVRKLQSEHDERQQAGRELTPFRRLLDALASEVPMAGSREDSDEANREG